ncbi:hypothetical protein [Nitrosomonas ureae]|uniref:hypothetical protein n=1 Tax=Nitrosomonas ureae TaxID=44577 RepID=UPI00114405E9|nr:hypothetical protein [Nitrosomonas ureae]
MKMELSRTQYSQEFREQSVKFFKEIGLTLVEAAKRLSLPQGALKKLGLCWQTRRTPYSRQASEAADRT